MHLNTFLRTLLQEPTLYVKAIFHTLVVNPALYLRAYSHPKPTRHLIIYAFPRTGSNLLLSLLNSRDDILVYGEPFHKTRKPIYGTCSYLYRKHLQFLFRSRDTRWYLNPFLEKEHADYPIVGGKFFQEQLSQCNISLTQFHDDLSNPAYIFLYRQDLVQVYISILLAERSKEYVRTKSPITDLEKIDVDMHELEAFCMRRYREIRDFYAAVRAVQEPLLLHYEALISDQEAVFRDQICPFLQIPYQQVQSSLQKQNPLGLEVCSNYDEVRSFYEHPMSRIVLEP